MKKKVFLSHTHADYELIGLLNHLLVKVFSSMFDIFDTSTNPLEGGSKWREEVKANLDTSDAVLVIITPLSRNRDWVFFEAGASWHDAEANKKKLIPCIFRIDEFPSPLAGYIGYDLSKAGDVRNLLTTLGGLIQIKPDVQFIENAIKKFVEEVSKIEYPVIDKQRNADTLFEEYKRNLVKLIDGFLGEALARKFIKLLGKHEMLDDVLIQDFLSEKMKRKF